MNEDEKSPEEEHDNLYGFDRSQTSQRFSGLPHGLISPASPAHGFPIVPPFTPQTVRAPSPLLASWLPRRCLMPSAGYGEPSVGHLGLVISQGASYDANSKRKGEKKDAVVQTGEERKESAGPPRAAPGTHRRQLRHLGSLCRGALGAPVPPRAGASSLGAPVPAGVGAALTLIVSHRQKLAAALRRSRMQILPVVAALAGLSAASPRGKRAEATD